MDSQAVSAIAGAAIGSITTLGTAWLAQKGERRRQHRLREEERARSFEEAQTGYRGAYRKFLVGMDKAKRAMSADGYDAAALSHDYWECHFAGDPDVARALRAYWPASKRDAGELADAAKLDEVLAAMSRHTSETFEQHQRRIDRLSAS